MSDERSQPPRRAMGQFSAETDGVSGQPPRQPRTSVKIAAGVEKVLYLAAGDAELRAALLADRAATLDVSGVSLTASERSMLLGIPAAQLEATIDALDVTPQNVGRRRFMRAVAASAAALTVGAAVACGDDETKPSVDAGVRTDMPWPVVDAGSRDTFWPTVDAGTRPVDMTRPPDAKPDGAARDASSNDSNDDT